MKPFRDHLEHLFQLNICEKKQPGWLERPEDSESVHSQKGKKRIEVRQLYKMSVFIYLQTELNLFLNCMQRKTTKYAGKDLDELLIMSF